MSFAAGREACSGHECQKHPSMKTATFARVKAMSTDRRFVPGIGHATRYRRPRACRSFRTEISGLVSLRRCLLIRSDTPAELGKGMDATAERYIASATPDAKVCHEERAPYPGALFSCGTPTVLQVVVGVRLSLRPLHPHG